MIRYNIFNIDIDKNYCEWVYINRIIDNIVLLLSNDEKNKLNFIITDQTEKILLNNNRYNIVYLVGDEFYKIPKYIEDVFLIFKNYVKNQDNKILPVPIGYNKDIIDIEYVPMDKRTNEVLFIGQCKTYNRNKMFDLFSKSKYLVKKTTGFKEGLLGHQYANLLMNSKISLCPDGNISSETFRYFESARFGNVIITTKKPSNYIYDNAPVIYIDDWNEEVLKLIDFLLNESNLINDISLNTLLYYNDICSEKSVACYIVNQIRKKLN
jgi:hypothetical protein